jgi:hypothetical protein
MSTSRSQNRRRRVVFDEAIQNAARGAAAVGESGSSKRPLRKRKYSSQARQSRRLADFIPKRWLSVAGITLAVLGVLAALNLLHWTTTLQAFQDNEYWAAAFSLDAPHGLSAWCMTSGCAAIGLYGCLVFGMRRHRRDDYRGTYRVWLVWVAIATLASIQTCVELDRALLSGLHALLGRDWLAPQTQLVEWLRIAVLTLVATRILLEIRHSRWSLALLSLGTLSATLAIAARLPQTNGWLPWELTILPANAALVAVMATLLATVGYVRFVYMDVFGLRSKFAAERSARREAVRRRKAAKRRAREKQLLATAQSKRDESQAAAATRTATETKSAPTATTPNQSSTSPSRLGPLAAKIKPALSASANSSHSSGSSAAREQKLASPASGASATHNTADIDSAARLSKSERKRLKKLQNQARRAA